MMVSWQRTLWVVFFAQLVSATGFSVMFPFLPLYVQQLGTNTGLSLEFWSAMAFSSQAITMAIASPFWGMVADRYGHKLMLERATFGGAVILLLMGFARSAEELALMRAIQGTITGTIAAANAYVASTAPRDRTGYAMGVLQLGLWIGIAAGPLIGGVLADALGYRAAFILTSALLLISGVVVALGLPRVRAEQKPGRKGAGTSWRGILTAPGVGLVYAIRFLSNIGQTMLLPVLPLFIVTLVPASGRLNSFTGLVVGVSSAATTASAVYLGRLGDRIGHRRVLIGSVLAAGLCYLPQSLVGAGWQLLALQALAGAAAGGIIPSLSALLARYTRPGSEGAVYGLDNSISSASRAVAPLAGAWVAVAFGLRGIFVVNGVVLLLGALLAYLWLPRAEASEPRAAFD